MSVLISAVAFVFLLSFLVILHELGHYFAAKRVGVEVEEFGFGLPPRAITLFWRKGTQFTLNWIPFGGFVRMKGENAEEDEGSIQGSFAHASIPARIVILVAGVFMNFLLAVGIFFIGFSVGHWIPTYLTYEQMLNGAERGEIHMIPTIVIQSVDAEGTAGLAGVPAKSELVSVDGTPIRLPSDVPMLQKGKDHVTYTIRTGDTFQDERTIDVPVKDGVTGVAIVPFPQELSAPLRSPVKAAVLAVRETKIMTEQTVLGIAQLFQSLAHTGTVPAGITGIIGIAQLTYASVQQGFMTYLRLIALLSLSLAVLNILPFPALDGGRLLFVLIEAIRRRPANRRFEVITNMAGFICLLILIAIITFYDIRRLF